MIIAEKMKRDWNQRARHHARFWIATEDYQTEEIFARSGETTARALLATIQRHYQFSWKVLDIGCGIGRVLKALGPYFHQLCGVDVSSAMIAQSKSWLADCPHIHTMENSGVDLREFPDSSFDLAYSYVTFQHMPRPVFERYLGEINRILTPKGYLAFQLPIGYFHDVPLEDTIGIRSYPNQEIEEMLHRNGLKFLTHPVSDPEFTHLPDPFNHHFRLAQKMDSIRPVTSMEWADLEQPHFVSELDKHLYAIYADDCARKGSPQEGIHTLQALVKNSPDYIAGWLQLATLLLETGQLHIALGTMHEFTTRHPHYHEGRRVLKQLLHKCSHPGFFSAPSLPTSHQVDLSNSSRAIPTFTDK